MGYLTLGQPCTTLSGGESQRIKLAAELSKRDTGSTLYILDEPTTGLHFEDIRQLIDVLNKLVDRGNTVVRQSNTTSTVVEGRRLDHRYTVPKAVRRADGCSRRVRRTRWPPSSRVIRDVFCGKWGFNGTVTDVFGRLTGRNRFAGCMWDECIVVNFSDERFAASRRKSLLLSFRQDCAAGASVASRVSREVPPRGRDLGWGMIGTHGVPPWSYRRTERTCSRKSYRTDGFAICCGKEFALTLVKCKLFCL